MNDPNPRPQTIGLTPRQRECLDFIARYLAAHGFAPSYDEIGDALGLRSKSGVHRLVRGLAERGHIRRLPDRARAIEILRNEPAGLPFFVAAVRTRLARARRGGAAAW